MSCMKSPFRKSKRGARSKEKSPRNDGSAALGESNNLSESAKGLLDSKRESDAAAVDWWRTHQHQQEGVNGSFDSKTGFGPSRSGDSLDEIFEVATVPPVFESFEQDQKLQTPSYDGGSKQEFRTELPKAGMVMDPIIWPEDQKDDVKPEKNPSMGIFQTKGRSDLDNFDMEVFQPELGKPPSKEQQEQWRSHSYRYNPPQNETTKALPPPRTLKKKTISFHDSVAETDRKPKNSRNLSLSSKLERDSGNKRDKEQRKKKQLLSKFLEGKTQMEREKRRVSDFSDHLSDVPSDVDSLTRERYLLACEMLKMAVIQKESSLIPMEKEYIMGLLDEFETTTGDDSVISEDRVTAVEHAIIRLESDGPPRSPTSAARAQKNTETNSQKNTRNAVGRYSVDTSQDLRSPGDRSPVRPPRGLRRDNDYGIRTPIHSPKRSSRRSLRRSIGKNPHTSTPKPEKTFLKRIISPCKPISARTLDRDIHPSDEFENELAVHTDIRDGSDFERIDRVEYDRIEYGSDYEDRLVRFDGWSFQNSEEYPFLMLGADGDDLNPRVFTPSIMEALRGFMPLKMSNHNFWLRYSSVRDGGSLTTLLATIRASQYSMIGVETDRGEVFGSFTGTPWRIGSKWYGCNEAFLWRLKKRRYTSPTNSQQQNFEREIEMYPCTGDDDLVQYCTAKTIAVGGGDWDLNACPYRHIDQGIGFMVEGDLARGETSSCGTFANPRLAKLTRSKSQFLIRNLEVWTLTPCHHQEDAAQMEINSLVREYGIA
eukprot:CAMPEP_0172375378 /NCGR_PEP_ID=MMETSP1060-20121228/61443_1 /TAXON_ID=37318 /ORGANISM="Pseudo-nitzschia pungens, Strain cf. cingulata" /LENGTH=765 /DNA_ID=CAMNT_0013102495 /DNA_START=490 /DNA_END=2787 /DNA_ORIENTATION=+